MADTRNIAVVIPALNEALRIREVVQGALAHCQHVIVIDDGSDDGTAERIADLPVTLLRHAQRMGKGASLRDGFREALRQGRSGVLSMDGDGQHAAADIPRLLEAALRYPDHIVIGARLRKRASQPTYRRLANEFGDWGIAWATGYQVADSQSGQRYYPAAVCALDDVPGEDFVFEAQILISAAQRARHPLRVGADRVALPLRRRRPAGPRHPVPRQPFQAAARLQPHHLAHRRAGVPAAADACHLAPHPRQPAGDRRSQRRVRPPSHARPRGAMNETTAVDAAAIDVVILGGGLAGLTLAIQLKQRDPAIAVTVLERRAHPVREAAFKVGESTVEIGAHYFADVLGFREHLETEQIRKFGFRFFFSEGRSDLDRCTELGVSELLPTPSWQLDRGRFENFLGEQARALGVDFRDGAVVRAVALADDDAAHAVSFECDGAQHTLPARWVVDASGRAGVLKRKLDLAQANDHDANAVWWRVDGFVDPSDWSDDPTWLQRCDPPDRWRSTNHMCGPGYWFWLIPLGSGAHSLGIVCDAKMHPLETMNTHEKAMAWLREHQPGVATFVERPQHTLQDFLFLRHFSYGCKQLFSGDRWALTGEAGLFLDPFYSPGSDFIAISNTYICDLIAKDRAGQSFAPYASIYQQLYLSFYENTLSLYQDQYPLFGDAQVMPVKVIWDYTYYWALLAPLFFGQRLTDIALLGRLRPQFSLGSELNRALQALLRDWYQRNDAPLTPDSRFLNQFRIEWFHEMNRALNDVLDDAAFAARIAANVARMQWLATEILARARATHPDIDDHGLEALLADAGPAVASLASDWYADAA